MKKAILMAAMMALFCALGVNAQGAPKYPDTLKVPVTFYDFHANGSNPEFEPNPIFDFGAPHVGMVNNMLDAEKKPVLGAAPYYNCSVNKWFRRWQQGAAGNNIIPNYANNVTNCSGGTITGSDTAFKNIVFQDTLIFRYLAGSAGTYVFEDQTFYPLDGKGFGHEGKTGSDGQLHNFGFAMELHWKFTKVPGLRFDFTGDDDVWAYLNNRLAMDLGGIHVANSGTILVDNLTSFGLQDGTQCDFDFFYCERHTDNSTIKITSNIISVPDSIKFSTYPPVATIPAGKSITVFATILDNSGIPLPDSMAKVNWSVTPTEGTTLSAKVGDSTKFSSTIAHTSYTITGTFPGVPDCRTTIYVKPDRASHLNIEASPDSNTSLYKDNRMVSATFQSTDAVGSTQYNYAVLRDKYGNFVKYATPPLTWGSRDTSIARDDRSNDNGRGVITRRTISTASTFGFATQKVSMQFPAIDSFFYDKADTVAITVFDSVKINLTDIKYKRARISSTWFIKDTISSLNMRTDMTDTTLYAFALRDDNSGIWDLVQVNWSASTNLKFNRAAPQNASQWQFKPDAAGTGKIYISYQSAILLKDSINAVFNVGLPYKVVLYQNRSDKIPLNSAASLKAGAALPLIAKVFDKNDTLLAIYQNATHYTEFTWTMVEYPANTDMPSATYTPKNGDSTNFYPMRAYNTVDLTITLRPLDRPEIIIRDTLKITIIPGDPAQLTIEADSMSGKNNPHKAPSFDAVVITENETYKNVYAMIRDALGNYIDFSKNTDWKADPNDSIVSATAGKKLIGEGVVTRNPLILQGNSHVIAFDKDNPLLRDTVIANVRAYHYTHLMIVRGGATATTPGANLTQLTMSQNDDTTLVAYGQRSDNDAWELVTGKWATSTGLSVAPAAPGNAISWRFSPLLPGTGFIRLYLDDTTAVPDTLPVTFTPGPITNVTVTIITPPEKRIAGDTITAVVRAVNKDGPIPDTCISSIHQDSLGTGGRKDPPTVTADGGTTPLNQKPSTASTATECFFNGLDTVKYVLYYVPDNGGSNKIYVTISGVTGQTDPFKLLPGPLDSLVIVDANNRSIESDSLTPTAPGKTYLVIGYDQYGNKRSVDGAVWTATPNIPPLTGATTNVTSIFYKSNESVIYRADGTITVTVGPISDNLKMTALPKQATLLSATTGDINGNGYLDQIVLVFNKKINFPATGILSDLIPLTAEDGKYTLMPRDIIGVNGTLNDSVFIVSLQELQNNVPQTGWTPRLTISDAVTDVAPKSVDGFPVFDGAGPVVWSVVKTVASQTDRTKDLVTVTFSEPIGTSGNTFDKTTNPPGYILHVWEDSVGLDKVHHFVLRDYIFKGLTSSSYTNETSPNQLSFYMTDTADLTSKYFINLDTTTIARLSDKASNANGLVNKPIYNNQKVRVTIAGAPAIAIIAAPNPSGPTFKHVPAGVLDLAHNPSARDWVRKENAGTVITFPVTMTYSSLKGANGLDSVDANGRVVLGVNERMDGTLKIFDIIGNVVNSVEMRDMVPQSMATDSTTYPYDIYWNGSNKKKMKVAPGIYRALVFLRFYNKKTQNFIRVTKLYTTIGINK